MSPSRARGASTPMPRESARSAVRRGPEQQKAGPVVGSLARDFPVSYGVFTVARAHRGVAASLLAQLGLYTGQELILVQLRDRDGQSQKELAELERLDPSTIAKSVRRLETAGLVERRRAERDGRVQVVSLTVEGRRRADQVMQAWSALEEATTRSLSPTEARTFVRLATKIASGLA